MNRKAGNINVRRGNRKDRNLSRRFDIRREAWILKTAKGICVSYQKRGPGHILKEGNGSTMRMPPQEKKETLKETGNTSQRSGRGETRIMVKGLTKIIDVGACFAGKGRTGAWSLRCEVELKKTREGIFIHGRNKIKTKPGRVHCNCG